MKIGLENKKEVIIAAVIAALDVWYGFHQFGSGGTSAPSPVSANNAAVRSNVRPRSQQRAPATVAAPSLDPRLKLDLLRSSEQIAYAGTGRNIFQDLAELPKPGTKIT